MTHATQRTGRLGSCFLMLATTAALAACSAAPGDATGEDDAEALASGQAVRIVGDGGRCLDAKHGSSADGTRVQLFTCNGTAAQRWLMVDHQILGPGGKCIQIAGGVSENEAVLELGTCNKGASQKWSVGKNADFGGDYEIFDPDHRCFDIPMPVVDGVRQLESTNGTRPQLWTCWGGRNQLWKIEPVGAPVPPPPQPTHTAPPPTSVKPPLPPPTMSSNPPPPPSGSSTGSPPPPAPTCTSFTYSAWGACQSNGTQTRTETSASPKGCNGGSPVLSQKCTYIDGEALYTQYCAGCHGSSKKGSSVSLIDAGISGNIGGMGSLSSLSAAQIAAISAAP